MSAAQPIVELRGVRRTFPSPAGAVEALRHVDLAIDAGEFVAVTGPSGSGKSTCLHLAALLDRPSGGSLRWRGREVGSLSETELCALRREKIGIVFQQFHLLAHRSARDNVRFRFRYASIARDEAERKTDEALELLDLGEIRGRPARLLSGGEMQRVAIARAIASGPELLIADEPTGNLDAASTQLVMESFRRLNGLGHTILLATHNESLIGACSRRIDCRSGCIQQ